MRHRWRTAMAFLALVGCSGLAGALVNRKLGPDPRPVIVFQQAAAPAQGPASSALPPTPVDPGPVSQAVPEPAGLTPPPAAGDPSSLRVMQSNTAENAVPAPRPEPADPVRAVETFIKSNRQQAEATIKALNAEADQLRARLAKVEDALARWEALSEALKAGDPGIPAPGMELTTVPVESQPPLDGAPADEPMVVRPAVPSEPARAPNAGRTRARRPTLAPAPSRTLPPPAVDDQPPAIQSQPQPRRPAATLPPPAAAENGSIRVPDPGQPASPPSTPDPGA